MEIVEISVAVATRAEAWALIEEFKKMMDACPFHADTRIKKRTGHLPMKTGRQRRPARAARVVRCKDVCESCEGA